MTKPFELLTNKEKIERLEQIMQGYTEGHNQIEKIQQQIERYK